jgi:hypothetical protein
MALDLSSLFGAPPDYSAAFSPEQSQQMQKNAVLQGGIGALIALLGASGPQTRQISTGQALAGALGAGYGGYQSSFDTTLKQLLTAQQLEENKQKQEARKRYQEALKAATSTQPVGIGLTQTGAGSQAQMLQDQTREFGQEGIDATLRSLQSNVNLPQQQKVDFDKLREAALMYAADQDPIEAAKLLQPKEGKETFTVMSAEQKRERLLPVNQPYQISSSGKVSEIGSGPQTVVKVMPAESARQTGYGKLGVEQNTAIFTSGQSAVKNIAKIDETLNLIEQGTPTTGIGADLINNINRTKLLFTDSKKNIKDVSDTELLNSLLGADVFPQIGALGIGAKGLDTPAEREFLRQVMTGTINMNKDTLIRMTNLRKKYEEKSLTQYNDAVETGQLDELFQFSGLPKRKLTVPSGQGLPPGVTVRKKGNQ